MKFTTSQSDLSHHLSFVSRAIPSRPSHPILANVLVKASGGSIALTGFDLSLGIQTTFEAEVEVEGTLTLPAKLLNDIVSRLPDGDVTVEEEVESTVSLTCASGRYQVRGMGADEYPELPTVDGTVSKFPVDAIVEGIKGTLFAVSTDETRQLLTGVHITANTDGIEIAGVDGHRLSVIESVIEGLTADFEVTVPSKALQQLEKMLGASKEESIAIAYDAGQLIIEWESQKLTTRLLEGQYPNYRQLIPKMFSKSLVCDRKVLIASLERIAVIADQKNSIVKFAMNSNSMVLSVDAQDVGSGRETLEVDFSGDPLEIAFNVKYVLEGLKAMDVPEIQMNFNTATSPITIVPLGGEAKMTYLVMPVQIRD